MGSGRGLGEVSGVQRGSAGVSGGAEKGWELGLERRPLGGKRRGGGTLEGAMYNGRAYHSHLFTASPVFLVGFVVLVNRTERVAHVARVTHTCIINT